MLTIRANLFSGYTPLLPSTRMASPVPAQLTTMRTGPSVSARSKALATASSSVTSAAAKLHPVAAGLRVQVGGDVLAPGCGQIEDDDLGAFVEQRPGGGQSQA